MTNYCTFYVRNLLICVALLVAFQAKAQITTQIGNGTQAPITNDAIYSPVCRFSASSTNDCSRSNLLYSDIELNSAGITPGSYINKISFYKIGTGATTAGFTFQIYMRNSGTTAPLSTTTTWADILTTHTQVYATTTQTISALTGWVEFTLSSPFLYTGQNLEIAMSHDMTSVAGNPTTGPFDWQYTNGYENYIIGNVGSSLAGVATLSGTVVNYKVRPNILFDYTPGPACSGTPVAGTAIATNTNACVGTPFSLYLTGNTTGTGQTYQWEDSAAISGSWSPIGSTALMLSVMPQVGTTYYRCKVTCGAAMDISTIATVNAPSPMSGPYTIDATQPVSPTNFQSVSAALSLLSCAGVSGHVVINIIGGSGPYNEQAVLGPIAGTSPSSKVTINGNGETISYTSTASENRPTIQLNGASYVTLKNLNIQANGTMYGWGVHFTNNADNDTIMNSNISISSTSTTAANSAGVVVSGSGTSVTTAGNSDGIVALNNNITGGYQGIIITGATAAKLTNNKVIGNTIKDFYSDGIIMTHNIAPEIAYNNISRALRTTVTTFTGIELGAGNSFASVNANKIHDTHNSATTQNGTAYGVHVTGCDAVAGEENYITNNLVYNFNSATGTQHALINTSSDGARFYFNTIVLDNGTSTSGTTASFYQNTLAANIHVKNNVFYVRRSGTGNKHCIYLNTAGSTVVADSNILYMNAPAGNNYIGRFSGNDYALLSTWQSQGFDLMSSNLIPDFANPSGGDYATTNAAVNNMASPNPNIPLDINGNLRSTIAPDAGAFENGNAPLDVKLISLAANLKNDDVVLEWNVAMEKDMDAYEIERSENGRYFTRTGTVKAKNILTGGFYEFQDRGVVSAFSAKNIPMLYYRLKMLQKDAKFTYSPVQNINLKERNAAFVVSPNPFKEKIILTFNSEQNEASTVVITDLQGKTLLKNTVQIQKGINNLEVSNIGLLPRGAYMVSITINGTDYTQRVVK